MALEARSELTPRQREILAHVVRSWWLVLPEAHRFPGRVDVVCMVGLGAFLLGAVLFASRKRVFERVQAHV